MIGFTLGRFKLRDVSFRVISFYCQIDFKIHFDEALFNDAGRSKATHPADDAIIIGENDSAERVEAQLLSAHQKNVQEGGAEADPLKFIDNRQRDFGGVRIVGQANEASNAQAWFARKRGVHGDPRDMSLLVHLG